MAATMAMTSDVSCKLVEVDFASIEPTLIGWWMNEPSVIRWARLGIYAAVTALKIGQPADLLWPEDRLRAHLNDAKAAHPTEYDLVKKVTMGTNYGLTLHGMTELWPEHFPTETSAAPFQDFLFALAPGLPKWQADVRKEAKDKGYLGGPGQHPYGYRHWFWDVCSYKPCDEFTARKWLKDSRLKYRIVYLHGRPFETVLGGDAKRAIAFKPQSTASGRLKEAEYDLLHPDSRYFIGDVYFGRTPLLAPIHDSLFMHIPTRVVERVLEIVTTTMQRPSLCLPCPAAWNLGSHLAIGVSAKVGRSWDKMEKVTVPELAVPITPIDDGPTLPREAEDIED